ncbi:biosynthetic-type acetolactate synthase large subunit [Conexibacter woesei]|uniref:Acetolactate synthase n=1 Tax=Conexibacter woesei (strain DSM 14684 / CCUG 47730 / CIP 108061 / JCM 11494 / NBRC 100937 / ID131577) TaxID=469383 RepID=D3FF53_CONWI|nr:biosynthetic-type acetolactate synthase large subunit [Conexibacter woesei]ADB51770.1 acetolactate synthase, large subunit, biosynthetic type [Conexibacter woesei DSM 14684]
MTQLHDAAPTTAPPAPAAEQRMLGADVVLRAFEAEGVRVCFGIPGGAVLPLYDAIARGTSVRHVLARHEQGAGHMAEAYARVSGEPGVVLATSGPGATNLVTPIANAQMDSTALVCVTGQVRTALIGTQAFQECDIVSVVRPLVKGAWLVRDVAELAGTLRAAFALARAGRPGPVLVDVPRDVQEAEVAFAWPPVAALPPHAPAAAAPPAAAPPAAAPPAAAVPLPVGAQARTPATRTPALDPRQPLAVARAIERAARPVLYAGGGVVNADAGEELRALAEHARIPVVTTLMGKGALPESHELFCGWPGMHGTKAANWTLNRADLVIAVGARFDDRVTGRLDAFAPAATVAHFDVDPGEIGKLRHAELPVLGPLRDALARTLAAIADPPDTTAWREQVRAWRARFPLRYDTAPRAGAPLKPQRVLERLDAALRARPEEVVWTTGVGQHQMWAMQYLGCERPRSFVTSGGHGTMGFGLPAAVGARAARPDATVVCVDGDGSFQMTAQELATAVAAELPVVVVIVNNGGLGMVHQWQTMFYERRLSAVDLSEPTDCAQVARGFGAAAWTVTTEAEFDAALAQALDCGRAAVLDVHVEVGEACFPMIPPGAAAVDMVEWPGS